MADAEWWITCPRCGRAVRAADVGVVRIGARSKGKRTLGRCSRCHRYVMARVERLAEPPPGAVNP
jgi:uncharacterized C2H2 Zn-finger protein